jgi:hypothetical protein
VKIIENTMPIFLVIAIRPISNPNNKNSFKFLFPLDVTINPIVKLIREKNIDSGKTTLLNDV